MRSPAEVVLRCDSGTKGLPGNVLGCLQRVREGSYGVRIPVSVISFPDWESRNEAPPPASVFMMCNAKLSMRSSYFLTGDNYIFTELAHGKVEQPRSRTTLS